MRRNQGGMTLTSFVMVAAVVGFFLFIGMKLFPMYQEFYSVKSALKGMAAEPDIANQDVGAIKDKFFKRMDINYSTNVKPENVRIENKGNGQTVYVSYEVRVPMVYNLDIVGKFDAEQALGSGGGGN